MKKQILILAVFLMEEFGLNLKTAKQKAAQIVAKIKEVES